MSKKKVSLDEVEKKFLSAYVSKGVHSARSIRRAHSLLLLDQGLQQKQVAAKLGCDQNTICNLVRYYRQCHGDVVQTLLEKPRSGQPTIITPQIEAHVTALACSDSGPDGRSSWTLQLIADNLVELNYIDSISHETVRRVLKKVSSSPGNRSSGVSAR